MHRLALEAAAEAETQLRSRILDLETQLEAEQEVGQGVYSEGCWRGRENTWGSARVYEGRGAAASLAWRLMRGQRTENRVRDAQADSSRERNLHLLHHLIGCEWRSNPPTVRGGVPPLLCVEG